LARRFREDLLLDGKRPKTIVAYLSAMAHLGEHFRTAPDQLSEEQVRQYLLLRREQLKLNSLQPILGAMKFFCRVTVPRE